MRLFGPELADVFVWCEAFEGLEPLGEVVDAEEVGEVLAETIMAVVVVTSDRGFLDRSVHGFDLAVGPRMVGLGQAMIDIGLGACEFEGVGSEQFTLLDGGSDLSGSRAVVPRCREVGSIISEHGVDFVRDRVDQSAQEVGSCAPGGSGLSIALHFTGL